jgi:hypothetical protein
MPEAGNITLFPGVMQPKPGAAGHSIKIADCYPLAAGERCFIL